MIQDTTAFREVPVTSSAPAYYERVALDGKTYRLFFRFNDRTGFWLIDLFDSQGNPLAYAIPLFPDYPLNWRYAQRVPGMPPGLFFLIDEASPGPASDEVPGRNDLGNGFSLHYLPAGS
jgi:hypothetical protein